MAGLEDVRTVQPPTSIGWGVDRVYPSPDRTMALRLSGIDEIRMGAHHWRTIEVVRLDGSESATRLTLSEHAFWTLVDCYLPWNVTSDRVVVPTLRFDGATPMFGSAIFDLRRATATELVADGWVKGAVWSPTDDQLLIATRHSIRVVSATGSSVATVLNSDSRPSAAVAGWTPNGSAFFRLAGRADGSVVRFFEPGTGEWISEVPVDPALLVPYDASAYAEIDRGPYSLKVGSGTWATGALLDDWSSAEYDAAHSTMTLSVYRPTSTVQSFPRPGGGEVLGCEARKVWISATVVD